MNINTNVTELLTFTLNQPEARIVQVAISGNIVQSRKAAAWANHMAQMARRFCLVNGLAPDHFTCDDILVAASAINRYYIENNPLAEYVA